MLPYVKQSAGTECEQSRGSSIDLEESESDLEGSGCFLLQVERREQTLSPPKPQGDTISRCRLVCTLSPSCFILFGFHMFLFVCTQVEMVAERCYKAGVERDGVFPASIQAMDMFREREPQKVEKEPSLYIPCVVCIGSIQDSIQERNSLDNEALAELISTPQLNEALNFTMSVIKPHLPLRTPLEYLVRFMHDLDEHELLRDQRVKEGPVSSEELESRLLCFFRTVRNRFGELDAFSTCFLLPMIVSVYDETLCRMDPFALAGLLAEFVVHAIFREDAAIQNLLRTRFTEIGSRDSDMFQLKEVFRVCGDRVTHRQLHRKFPAFWECDSVSTFGAPVDIVPERKKQRTGKQTDRIVIAYPDSDTTGILITWE